MNLGIRSAKAACLIIHIVTVASGTIVFFCPIPSNLFRDGSGIFSKHFSDFFKGASLKEFLFYIGTV